MHVLGAVLGWILTAVFGLLLLSMVLLGNYLAAMVLAALIVLSLPPAGDWLESRFGRRLHPALRAVGVVALLFLFGRLLMGGTPSSIFASEAAETRFHELYDREMAQWPVPYQDVFIPTSYGEVHAVASGPEDAPPVLLLHASGVSSWSWRYNVGPLSEVYRTYAIDLIGDAGKSEYSTLEHVMRTGEDQASLYAEIMDSLGVETARVVGASEGGFIASNLARYRPDRVERVALLGPMGYSGATRSIVRITLAQLFPIGPVQRSTFRWAFGDGDVASEFQEWFLLIMNELRPMKVAPLPLAPEDRRSIRAPVLFVFGERDRLVGDPGRASATVQDMHDVQVHVVDAGHLVAAEHPDEVNAVLLRFLASD